MVKYENEEHLKEIIFNKFQECLKEDLPPDRLQTNSLQLCEQIYEWLKIFHPFNLDIRGVEIANITLRIIKKEKLSDKDAFFKYLFISIKNAKAEYYRKYHDEKNVIGIDSIDFAKNESTNKTDNNPLYKYLFMEKTQTIKSGIKAVLEKKQERSRDCYRALFTLYCINKFDNFTELYSVLDNEVLKTCTLNERKPKQYEIYMKYHPTAQKNAAETMASKNMKEFIKDLEEYLKLEKS